MVSQPGRSLPDLPKDEEVTPRRGYNGEPWANDLLQGNLSDHVYQCMDDTEKLQGARRKHPFNSLSTVRLDEKLQKFNHNWPRRFIFWKKYKWC